MRNIYEEVKDKSKIILGIKILICLTIIINIASLTFHAGVNFYSEFKDYSGRIEWNENEVNDLAEYKEVRQLFNAKGNHINNVSFITGPQADGNYTVSIETIDNKTIVEKDFEAVDLHQSDWTDIGLSTDKLKRNQEYYIVIKAQEGLAGFYSSVSVVPEWFGVCYADQKPIDSHLVMGMSSTYSYHTLADISELCVRGLFVLFLAIMLCVCVLYFERIYSTFAKEKQKNGFSYALYFATSMVFLYNPLAHENTKVVSFKRIMGAAVNADIDVSRRISNFNHWFIGFGIAFIVYFLLANYLLRAEKSEECEKVQAFLDQFMVLANCNLFLRAITFFKDNEAANNTFYLSQNVIMLVVIALIVYITIDMGKYITVDTVERLLMISIGAATMLTIFYGRELGSGRVFIGILCLITILLLVFARSFANRLNSVNNSNQLSLCAIIAAAIPLLSSLYIELIHVLNQHYIFVAHPAKFYKVACLIGLVVVVSLILLANKKSINIKDWKQYSFPLLIVGIACLSIQIPLSSTYTPDLFEAGNISVLLRDFLNYGDIPIVQHYGGHMMTGVWEGILYAIVNNDYTGIVSPYESLLTPVLVLLFYIMISKIWNREMALVVALLFPFLDIFSYYGLGVLVCIAAMAYVQKNTWWRAIALWGAFIWCALYRLDLGYAFGAAVIITMMIYGVINKNWKAIKQLSISLLGWGLFCGLIWFIICFIKRINPINRLVEFLMINLSNQNWAFDTIGDVESTVFAWGYLIIPLTMVVACVYTIFSHNFREKIGVDRWVLLLILGFSYFENYSRGLVRHSLVENSTTVVFWCAYLYFALFISFYNDNMKYFVPSLMAIILLNTLFISDSVFSGCSVADSAIIATQPIIESWKPSRFYDEGDVFRAADGTEFNTSWEEIKYEQHKADRVVLDDEFKNYCVEYEYVLDALLDEDETFVDLINKTVLYSVLERRCPVYVSQSPIQLSGEFAQKEFIKEIKGVPVVLMPVDSSNNRASVNLDGITNAYRYYKVFEYVYQNYKPLCKYGEDFAVWCLPEKYDEYTQRLSDLLGQSDYVKAILQSDTIIKNNIELETSEDKSLLIKSVGDDPMLSELQTVIDISSFVGREMRVMVDYETDTSGKMELYYTTENGEDYSGEKVESVDVSNTGSASFVIPITEFTRFRLDPPDGSTVVIKSFVVNEPVEFIDYGYDGPIEYEDENGETCYRYINKIHNVSIADLPKIWAETDNKDAANNKVLCEATNNDGLFTFDNTSFKDCNKGNYIKMSATYDGTDTDGSFEDNDEYIEATLILGDYRNGEFREKCRYDFNIAEGYHDYLFRCSADYYWYIGQINAAYIDAERDIRDVKMEIIEDD